MKDVGLHLMRLKLPVVSDAFDILKRYNVEDAASIRRLTRPRREQLYPMHCWQGQRGVSIGWGGRWSEYSVHYTHVMSSCACYNATGVWWAGAASKLACNVRSCWQNCSRFYKEKVHSLPHQVRIFYHTVLYGDLK